MHSRTATRLRLSDLVVTAVLLGLFSATAVARQEAPPASRSRAVLDLADVPVVQLPAVDVQARLDEDARATGIGPLRYAVPAEVSIMPQDAGRWEQLADGGRIWRLRFHAPGATDLNFGFTRFTLPAGATLHVYSEAEDYFEGPYTHLDNETHGQLWVPVVPGERAVVELYLPKAYKSEPILELTRVGRGYRDLLARNGTATRQGACNNDVICPEGDPWRDQIRSVAVYSLGGGLTCTGQMVIDVPGTFTPYFLTASHCGVSAGNAPSMTVYWNYESPVCGALSGGSLSDNQTGAIFRASKSDVDFALVELDDAPDPGSNVFYSGWDRSGNAPQGSVGIHHPSTDEKAISFNSDTLTTTNSCIGGGSNTHWLVDDWEDGTTEPGSSGSGIWDPDNQLLVGTLSGGQASCSFISFDCYGKFSLQWDTGGSPSSRLSDWLDPLNQGPLTVQGADPSGAGNISFVSNAGTDTCAADPGNENGLWEPGETIEVPVVVRSTATFTGVSGTLTSSTPGVTIVDGTASWPTLVSGADTQSNAPHFTVSLAESVPCGSQIDFTLALTANEGGPFNFAFSNDVGSTLMADVPKSIPDAGTTTSTLVVGENVTLTDVNVFLDVAHTYVGDLTFTLRSPAGTEVVLLDRPGVPVSQFGCSDSDMQVTFDDASGFDLETHCAGTTPWYNGVAAAVGSLAAFNGQSSAGTWTLTASDGAGQDTGTVLDWQLVTEPPLTGSCMVCGGGGGSFTLGSPVPGLANETNTWDVSGASPNGTAYLFAGLQGGSSTIPLGACPGITVDMATAFFFGSTTADGSGDATFSRTMPAGGAGRTVLFQSIDRSSCTVSNLVSFDFP